MKTILLLSCLVLCACQAVVENGKKRYIYIGPTIGASIGFNGVAVSATLYGPAPSLKAEPTPTPAPTPSSK